MVDLNFDALLGSPQVKRWHKASELKKLKRNDLPFEIPYPLEVWNYDPCHRHEKPQADCQWHECGGHPYRHQKITASYSYVARRSIVGNSTGTGKSLSALLTLALEHHYGTKVKALIVVPTISVKQWTAEAKRWTPGFNIMSVPAGTPKQQRLHTYADNWDILIIGYHVATKDVEHLDAVDISQVVVDDVDPSLSVSNKTYRALEMLCRDADLVIDQNATSLQVRLQQLYAASCLIGAKPIWGSEKNFTSNYVQRDLVTVKIGQGKKKRVYQATGYKNLAQPLTSKVMTPQGWRAIGSLKVGDPLVTSTGDTQTVTKITDLGVQDVWEVQLRDGSTAQAAGDHLWEVECPDGVTRVLLTTELMQYNRPVKIHQGCGPNEGVTPEVDPYLVGYLLGDGYTKGSSISFICNHKELDVLENITLPPLTYISREDKFENHTQYHITNELVKETICKRCSKDSDMRSRNLCYNCYQLSWSDGSLHKYPKAQQNPLKEYLTKVDVWGHTGRNKKLPSGWESWSREARLSLLQGILDADGSSTTVRSRIILNGVSPFLVEGVCQLARSLGLHSYFRIHTMGKSSFKSRFPYKVYRTEILWDGKTPLFRTKHKASKLVKVGKSIRGRSVVSVTRLPDAEVRCIEVSSPDKLYVTDSYMLTHNSDFKRKFEPMFIQFTYDDIADDVTIPSLVTEQVYLDMSPKQRSRYTELQEGVRTLLNKDDLPVQQKAIGALAAFTIGSQICAGTFALKNTDGGYEKDGPEASPKLDWIMDKLTGEWINEKAVVYAKFRGSIMALQDRLKSEGISSSTIWGVETDANVRQAEMERFWQDPDTRVMIISVSGERSLNLQNASILVMWDMQLNPARVTQIAGRVRRVGSKHKRVFVFELLHNNSQEDRYMAALASRQALYDHVFDVESEGEDNLLIQKLDPEELLRLIRP